MSREDQLLYAAMKSFVTTIVDKRLAEIDQARTEKRKGVFPAQSRTTISTVPAALLVPEECSPAAEIVEAVLMEEPYTTYVEDDGETIKRRLSWPGDVIRIPCDVCRSTDGTVWNHRMQRSDPCWTCGGTGKEKLGLIGIRSWSPTDDGQPRWLVRGRLV